MAPPSWPGSSSSALSRPTHRVKCLGRYATSHYSILQLGNKVTVMKFVSHDDEQECEATCTVIVKAAVGITHTPRRLLVF